MKGVRKISWLEQIIRRYRKKKEGTLIVRPAPQRIARLFLVLFLVIIFAAAAAVRIAVNNVISDISRYAVEVNPVVNTGVAGNKAMQEYTNIALFGVDSRDDNLNEGGNRSDTIIIMSINNKSGNIKMLSLMRDTYLQVDEKGSPYEHGKANSAYSYGGAQGALSMINRNMDMNITEFVTVGFEELMALIDNLGGIDMELTEDEVKVTNKYIDDMKAENIGWGHAHVSIDEDKKEVHLNGIQAVSYARNRYSEGGDIGRSKRARKVLIKTAQKGLTSGPLTAYRVLRKFFTGGEIDGKKYQPCLHSLDKNKMKKLLWLGIKIKWYKTFSSESFDNMDDFPRKKNRYEGMSFIWPTTLKDNIVWLHSYLFNDEDYEVSEEAMEISDYIRTKEFK